MKRARKSNVFAPTGPNKNHHRAVRGNVFDWLMRYGDDEMFNPPPAAEAIDDLPGSADKIEKLAERVQNGESIWHVADVLEGDRHDMKPSSRSN